MTSYSDAKQDEWILSQFTADFKGYAVELGALDGRFLSNTLRLEEAGWTCLCIEPNPRHSAALKANRKLVMVAACDGEARSSAMPESTLYEGESEGHTLATLRLDDINFATWRPGLKLRRDQWRAVAYVPVLRLDDALDSVGFPRLDVLSLDVDGHEESILWGFDFARWHPRLVVLETSAENDPRVTLIESKGYRRDCFLGHDSCFVHV